MVSVHKALQLIKDRITYLSKQKTVLLHQAKNYYLAEAIISPINMPPFRQSAMDGYGLNRGENSTYRLIDEVKAGDTHHPFINPGECTRIFTGAPVPDSVTEIAIQEKVEVIDQKVIVNYQTNPEDNIRPLGEQIKKGEIALPKGTKLTTAGIGFLASLGITEVSVICRPKIALVVTGNELVEPGLPLAYGQIYESNSAMLKSALHELNYKEVNQIKVADDYDSTFSILKDALNSHDLVLVCGGISVGDYDFVGKALNAIGVEQLFYKVNQKPGKPLYFGAYQNSYVFGLPGNPASALSCFYVYVQLALKKLSGANPIEMNWVKAKSISVFNKKGNRAQFLKAKLNHNGVEILEGQNSSMLHTYALANALVFLDENQNELSSKDEVDVILLPIQ